MTSEPLNPHSLEVSGRTFTLGYMRFVNGCFLAVSEGKEPRLGALAMATKADFRANVMTLLPDRFNQPLLGLIGELAANITGGAAAVSLYTAAPVDGELVRALLGEIRRWLSEMGLRSGQSDSPISPSDASTTATN